MTWMGVKGLPRGVLHRSSCTTLAILTITVSDLLSSGKHSCSGEHENFSGRGRDSQRWCRRITFLIVESNHRRRELKLASTDSMRLLDLLGATQPATRDTLHEENKP